MFKIVSISLLFLFLFANCNSFDENDNSIPNLSFTIDINLLDSMIIDSTLSIIFAPPRKWVMIKDKEILNKLYHIEQESTSYGVKYLPRHFFFNDSLICALTISEIKLDNYAEKPDSLKILYEKKIEEVLNNNFSKTVFRKDELLITQYLIIKNNLVNFKLLILTSKGNLLQFDYITSREIYFNEVKAIESSIGSIKKIKKVTGE